MRTAAKMHYLILFTWIWVIGNEVMDTLNFTVVIDKSNGVNFFRLTPSTSYDYYARMDPENRGPELSTRRLEVLLASSVIVLLSDVVCPVYSDIL